MLVLKELLLFNVVADLLIGRFSVDEGLLEGEEILDRRLVRPLLAEKCALQQRVVVSGDSVVDVALYELLIVIVLLGRCGRRTPLR